MLLLPNNPSLSTVARYTAFGLIAAMLAACGGGGGSAGTTGGVGAGSGTGTVTGTTPANQDPVVKLAIADGSGNAISTLSGGQSGVVKAAVTSATGAPVVGAIVKFTVSDATLGEFTPASGSALTDAAGIAVITVKPSSFTAAGALGITATSVIAGRTATVTSNIAVGAAPLTVGALTFVPAPVGNLPAFSALSLSIPVTSGGQPVNNVVGLTMSSLCVGDGKATLVAGAVNNGIQLATYTNNGCLRGRDTISVAVGNSNQTIGVNVDAANIGTVQFIRSNLSDSSIVLKGSGGLGRSEAAQLTFRVVDQHNNGLAGVDVKFKATTTTGGLAVTPAIATTDASGNVTTMVSSGTIPTPVRVTAEATRNGVTISGLSDTLTISTGLPIQRSMSVSADVFNLEGNYDGLESRVTVALADQYGNRVSDGTAVNFVSSGGSIGNTGQGACTTVDGSCTVIFKTQNFRPVNGRVTVLAFAQGIEDFTDLNGDGQYSCTNYVDVNNNVPAVYRPLIDKCVSGGEPFKGLPDAFLDAGNDGTYNADKGDLPFPYNRTAYSAEPHQVWGINYIRQSIQFVFSGSVAKLMRLSCTAAGVCRDWTAADGDPYVVSGLTGTSCSAQMLTFRLFDANNNPMPAGTTLATLDADKVVPMAVNPDKVPSTGDIGGTIHSVTIKPDAGCGDGIFSVKVETPKKNATTFQFRTK